MKNDFLKLSDIPTGEECVIVKVHGHGSFRNRIVEMGFVKGEKLTVIKNAPLHDPIEYKLMDGHISLRRSEASLIEVVRISNENVDSYNGTFTEEAVVREASERSKIINIALVGNPNCGKTSLFNHATGLKEKVGNYSGVTVDAKLGAFHHKGYTINMIDLPGTYSLTEYSPEELYVREYITNRHPDLVLNVVDASNLERNLFLTTQLIDMNIRVVMALNMYDELQRDGAKLDCPALSKLLGMPIVPTTASRGLGVSALLDKIIEVYEDQAKESHHIHINYGKEIEEAVSRIKRVVVENKDITNIYVPRYLSIKLLENDQVIDKELHGTSNYKELRETANKEIQYFEKTFQEDTKTIITNAKYGFIRGALKMTYSSGVKDKRKTTNSIDRLLTHKWLGFPFLIFFMWLTFEATFTLGAYPMDWINMGVGVLSDWIANSLPAGPLNDLLVEGVLAGVGGVIVFLPCILILFFFISLMEDTGYMARAAFIMDRLMHKIGLHGKSFIPLLIGYGCSVPAIMATRTLDSRRDRMITMLITPFMSCSARLPVYILFVTAFFVKYQALVLMSIYLIGIVIAVLTALLLKNTFFKHAVDPFVMELPPYRMPTMRNTLMHMWDKSVQYLKKMGTIILVASIVIWALGYFPLDKEEVDQTVHLEQSYIGKIGHFIEPVLRPLGFDWKMGVSIVTGFAAKEIVVSSMGILYHVPGADETSQRLVENLQTQVDSMGNPVFTPLLAYSFMLFILIYVPCMASVAAIKKEAGWKWAGFMALYTTSLAWVVSFLVYNIGKFFV